MDLALFLVDHGVEILSTGGTAGYLRDRDIPVMLVEEVTGLPSLMEGRLKTLDGRIFGPILADRDHPGQLADLELLGQPPTDLVVVNLYPFEDRQAQGLDEAGLVETIDIGGPSLLRAAAKNHRHVVVLSRPDQYPRFQQLYLEHGGHIPLDRRREWAAEVFRRTSAYDGVIGGSLEPEPEGLPPHLHIGAQLHQSLRYGENPHQRAGYYLEPGQAPPWAVLHGKELSFNNYADLESAADLVAGFEPPAVAIVKHANPCGFGLGETLEQATRRALSTDPVSSFGGIVGLNRPVDGATAVALAEIFLECILAPDYSPEALKLFTRKKKLRLLKGTPVPVATPEWDVRSVAGGYLVQDRGGAGAENGWEVASRRKPSPKEMQAMRLGWKLVKFVKSNAIVLTGVDGLLGVGAGQMSRIDAVTLAGMKATQARADLNGAALASDAFFPFADGVEEAARLGIRAVIQPGGSVRDQEVIAAVDQHEMTMIFTHTRHFRH